MGTFQEVVSERPTSAKQRDESFVSDTTLRCAIALALVRTGMGLVEFGARRVSKTHPAHHAYASAVGTWRQRVQTMPWWGFVPTDGVISATQSLWLIVGLLAVNTTLHLIGLPHLHEPLQRYVPRLRVGARLDER